MNIIKNSTLINDKAVAATLESTVGNTQQEYNITTFFVYIPNVGDLSLPDGLTWLAVTDDVTVALNRADVTEVVSSIITDVADSRVEVAPLVCEVKFQTL